MLLRKYLISYSRCVMFPTFLKGQPAAPCTFYWTCSFTSSMIFCVTMLTLCVCVCVLDFFSDVSRVDYFYK